MWKDKEYHRAIICQVGVLEAKIEARKYAIKIAKELGNLELVKSLETT